MGVAQLPAYENVGSALRDEISHMQDFWLYSSVETLSLLEGMNKDWVGENEDCICHLHQGSKWFGKNAWHQIEKADYD